MTGRRTRTPRLGKDASGVTAVEFALIAPVLLLFLMGFLDYGYWMYIRSTASGALESVARSASVAGTGADPATFQPKVENQIRAISQSPTFVWNTKSYYDFEGVGKPEKLVTDVDGDGHYDPGDCWEDANGNGTYDADSGRNGIGGADDIIYYQLTITFPPLIDIGGFVAGLGGNHSSTFKTIVRRQPFAAQATPAVRC